MQHRVFALFAALAIVAPAVAHAADSDVRVNSVGYLPARVKRASVTMSSTAFQVKRAADGKVAFEGTVTGPVSDAGLQVWTADFSKMTETGSFYVEVPNVGKSVTFSVSDDVYNEAFLASMLGFYGWRCNTAVSFNWKGQQYSHAACHMDDAHTDYISAAGTRDSKKGWHDAGDYGKYTVNAGVTLGAMLQAWEDYESALSDFAVPIPETGGALPDFLDEIKWELDWLLTMQYSATDGRVSHKVTSLGFDAFEMPEADVLTRYFVPWGSAATADFVAMLAKAARVYSKAGDQAFADKCLAAAKVSYAYLVANPANVAADQTGFSTGGYTTADSDDRLWAAAEMWETTGDAAALTDFETRAAAMTPKVDSSFDWGSIKNLGMFTYVLSQRTGRNATLVADVRTSLLASADALVKQRNAAGFGRDIATYWWGSNGSVARTCMNLQIANRLSPNADYVDTCVDQVAWLFGRNQYNRSQLTGLGIDPPMNPHHRPSGADGITNPWPGLLVGGGQKTATDWSDTQASYQTNEVAVNWNGALVYALASLMPAGASAPTTDGGVSGSGGASGSDAAIDSSGSGSGGAGGNGGIQGSDAGSSPDSSSGGCGCGLGGGSLSGTLLAVFVGLMFAIRLRRGRA